ncbi:MAG TPA: DMT family transporter [Patescibacteria group bacterium]
MNQSFGIVLATLSTVFYALLWPLFKKGSEKLPAFTVMTISMFVLFLTSLILSILFENSLHLKFGSLKVYIFFALLAGAVNVLAFWLEIQGFKFMPVWQQTLIGLLLPVFAAIFSFFILGEQLSINLFIGLAIIGVGLFVAIR